MKNEEIDKIREFCFYLLHLKKKCFLSFLAIHKQLGKDEFKTLQFCKAKAIDVAVIDISVCSHDVVLARTLTISQKKKINNNKKRHSLFLRRYILNLFGGKNPAKNQNPK